MSKDFLRVMVFVIVILTAFYYMASSIPQQASLPPVKENLDPSQIKTKSDLILIGKKLFFGKGQCALCHTIGPSHGARAPNLEGIGGKLTREFIYESLTQPDKYIFLDFESSPPKPFPAQMPRINKPPVNLSDAELLAVMSFVQQLGGEVTIEPRELAAFLPPPKITGDPDAGRGVFVRLACAGCHQQMPAVLAKYTNEESLRAAVVRPAGGTEGKPPHPDFNRKLSVKDLDDLMAHLQTLVPKTAVKAGN
ncbi:MAG: c-type cytochrome [Nitrospirae bacterium]|nr:c-type cytochrome [Nitrospirota bacterium]